MSFAGWTCFCLSSTPPLAGYLGAFCVEMAAMSPTVFSGYLLTAVAALVVMGVARWLTNPSESIWLLHRRVQPRRGFSCLVAFGKDWS